jgi:hypothetical protein
MLHLIGAFTASGQMLFDLDVPNQVQFTVGIGVQ